MLSQFCRLFQAKLGCYKWLFIRPLFQAIRAQIINPIFVSNSKNIVNVILGDDHCIFWKTFALVESCKCIFKSIDASIKWVCRALNTNAHNLSRYYIRLNYVLCLNECIFWLEKKIWDKVSFFLLCGLNHPTPPLKDQISYGLCIHTLV